MLKLPFIKVNEYEIIDSSGVRVRLVRETKKFLIWARNKGLYVASLSWNIRNIALEALKAFNIQHLFNDHYVEPHPHKGITMKKHWRKIQIIFRERIRLCQIIY